MAPNTDSDSGPRKTLTALLKNGFAIAALAAPLTLLPAATAFAAEPTASPADQTCLGCHGVEGMEKKLTDGDSLKLFVPPSPYLHSVHGANGCTSCHADVDISKHPPEKNDIASKRSFSLKMTQVCRTCHTDKFDQWQNSIHAALVKSGNPGAPVCTDCHNPHAVIKGVAATADQIPCKKCHSDIYTAWRGSVHGQNRLHQKDSYAPLCSGCHTAHSVQPVSIGALAQGPEGACLGCHADVLQAHEKWLPNAALHFQVVSCPACHVPNAQRKVDLMLINASNDKARGTEQLGVPLFEASTNSGGKGIDAQTLYNLLQTLDRSGLAGKTVVRGRLEVASGPQMHELAPKSQAISDCRTCHESSSKTFQSVTVSLVGPDGRRVGYGANADVLNSAFSVGAVSGFYAIGGTRIKLLDILLALAIFGGVSIAVGHVFIGWMFKRFGLYHPHNGHGGTPENGGDAHKPAA